MLLRFTSAVLECEMDYSEALCRQKVVAKVVGCMKENTGDIKVSVVCSGV
jgi:hypothetical protein